MNAIFNRFFLPQSPVSALRNAIEPVVHIEFNMTRGQFGMRLGPKDPDNNRAVMEAYGTQPAKETLPHVRRLRVPDGLNIQETVLWTRSLLETPVITAYHVETAGGWNTLQVGSQIPDDDSPIGTFQASDGPLEPKAYIAELEAKIQHLENTAQEQGERFFFMLDKQSHPILYPYRDEPKGTHRLLDMAIVMFYLRNRMLNRARISGVRVLENPASPLLRQYLNPVTDMMYHWIDYYYPDLSDYETAFYKFANGELRLALDDGRWTTEPSSALFFLFGEVAIAAAQVATTGSMTEWWRQVAGIHVGAQYLYVRAYPATKLKDPDFGSYNAGTFDTSDVQARRNAFMLSGRSLRGEPLRDVQRKAGEFAYSAFEGLMEFEEDLVAVT